MLSIFTLIFLFFNFSASYRIGAGTVADPKPLLRILPLGDSITWGAGKTAPEHGTNGYRAQLQLRLHNQGYTVKFVGTQETGSMLDKHNEGHPGFRISEIQEAVGEAIDSFLMEPNIVLIHAGTNDFLQPNNTMGESWEEAPERLGDLVDFVNGLLPGAVIIVAQILQSSRPIASQLNPHFNKKIPSILAERKARGMKVMMVNMGGIPPKHLYDRVHPSAAVYVRMGNIFATAIKSADRQGLISTGGNSES